MSELKIAENMGSLGALFARQAACALLHSHRAGLERLEREEVTGDVHLHPKFLICIVSCYLDRRLLVSLRLHRPELYLPKFCLGICQSSTFRPPTFPIFRH